MDRASSRQLATLPIEFKLNGRTVVGRPDETILETAKRHGVEIPHLCYMPGLRPDGNCRACVVEVKGERALAPSCCRYPKECMEVPSDSARAVLSQKMVLELLLSDMPEKEYRKDSELYRGRRAEHRLPRFKSRRHPGRFFAPGDRGEPVCLHPVHRCVRACRE